FVDAEREEPGCLLEIGPMGGHQRSGVSRSALLDAVRAGAWTGHANQLSEDHVQWTFIDDVAAATRDAGRPIPLSPPAPPTFALRASTSAQGASVDKSAGKPAHPDPPPHPAYPAPLLLQRRSAVALDGRSPI